ncbi:MFS transporter [Haloplanus aerogenes]|uniref:MFS transporter n=1 Tax=Haloplanus aerogenes TaxID=660522 RepID=A0A3M0DWG4_9EURY|nr:MFS transporter [Haloplanus aerogenes]AZH24356.1 MFS transporter [Haloplanus aerogenes]RMB24009.1 MFS transporter [Haloplanus aerogenes]
MTRTRSRVALAAVVYAVLLAQVLLYPGIDTLVAALGAGTALNASMWFLAAEFGAFVVFAVPWGLASDAAGKRVPFVAAGALLGAIGYVLLAVVPAATGSFGVALLLRIFQGAATVGAFSLSMTMLMDLEGSHGRNMGATGIAIGLGTATGAPLGGLLYELGPLVPLYAASAVFLAIAVCVPFVVDRAPDGERRSPFDGLRRTPTLALPYAFGFVDRLTAGFFSLVGTLYFRTVFDLSPGATGLTLALFFAPFALLQYPFGVVSDRIGRTIPIVAGSACYGVAVILVGAVSSLRAAQAGMVLVGVLGALMAPATLALVTDLAARTERGVAMAGFNIAGSLGFLAGILVGGFAADAYGYGTAFLLVGGLELALAAVTLPAFVRLDPGGERPEGA